MQQANIIFSMLYGMQIMFLGYFNASYIFFF